MFSENMRERAINTLSDLIGQVSSALEILRRPAILDIELGRLNPINEEVFRSVDRLNITPNRQNYKTGEEIPESMPDPRLFTSDSVEELNAYRRTYANTMVRWMSARWTIPTLPLPHPQIWHAFYARLGLATDFNVLATHERWLKLTGIDCKIQMLQELGRLDHLTQVMYECCGQGQPLPYHKIEIFTGNFRVNLKPIGIMANTNPWWSWNNADELVSQNRQTSKKKHKKKKKDSAPLATLSAEGQNFVKAQEVKLASEVFAKEQDEKRSTVREMNDELKNKIEKAKND